MNHENSTTENMDSRRRGFELEDALLNAAEEELKEVGYNSLTMKGVAERAMTSRTVINRRWNSRIELVLAIMRRSGSILSMDTPNTGNLRSDVLVLMNWFAAKFTEIGLDVIIGILNDTAGAVTPSFDLQKHMQEANLNYMSAIMKEAVARGEARTNVSPLVLTLPIDLLREKMLLSHEDITQCFLERIVDEIFLPLVQV